MFSVRTVSITAILSAVFCLSAPGQTAKLYEPFDWSFNNPAWSGNPFELVATATFTHATAPNIVTELFYNGGNTWKLRFTGTATGVWSFSTSSSAPALSGLTGSLTVTENPGAIGFITAFDGPSGTKWGLTGTNEAVVPQLVMFANPLATYQDPGLTDSYIARFLGDHGFNGFHTGVLCRWFDIFQDSYVNLGNDPNPDFRTFESLEDIINKTHAAGGMVHLWAWGDEDRRMTPIKWGINGTVDRRLQRYIAARLGPLPGWSMGYGFDLFEWVTPQQLEVWRNYMHSKMGWFHYLGGRPGGPESGTDHSAYVAWNQGLDYASYQHWRPTYDVYVASLAAVPGKPVNSEDRFRVRVNVYPQKDYSEEDTRRGLWISTMAGGVANIWGHLINAPADWGSDVYPNRRELLTYGRFWRDRHPSAGGLPGGRFRKGLVRHNALTTGGYCLRDGNSFYVFYRESTASIAMNLAGMSSPQPAFAVDTIKEYEEIPLGMLNPAQHTFNAPYASDWAVLVGEPPPASSVRTDLGLVDVESGLYRVIVGDGNSVPATIGGRDARRNANSAQDHYMYFNVAGTFAYQGSLPNVVVEVTYFDAGTGSLTLQYDATDGELFKNGGTVSLTNTNTWKTHRFVLPYAYFGNRQQGLADFRIFGGAGHTFYLDTVEVLNAVPGPPVIAPVSPDPQITFRNIPYAAQMALAQGYPAPSWTLLQGPPGAQVSGSGLVSGWTPADFGEAAFAVEAVNEHGSDAISWLVRVTSVYDLDQDGDVDVDDFALIQRCFSGDAVPYSPGCSVADLDGDGDVDGNDFNLFYPCLGGANVNPGC